MPPLSHRTAELVQRPPWATSRLNVLSAGGPVVALGRNRTGALETVALVCRLLL